MGMAIRLGALVVTVSMAAAFSVGATTVARDGQAAPGPAAGVKAGSDVGAAEGKAAAPTVDHARFGFLAGRWVGKMGEDLVEEHWSAPSGNGIMGMFRWCDAEQGQRANMLELLSINGDKDGVSLRLRHFSPALEPWASEKVAPRLMYNAEKSSASKAVFESVDDAGGALSGCEYSAADGDALKVTVRFKPTPKGARENLEFTLKREAAGK